MTGGEFLNQAGYSRELVPRKTVGNDEQSAMGALVIEESNREPDEIVPVSRHQTSFLRSCKFKLPLIRYLTHPNFMSTKCLNSSFSKYFGNLRTEVFIQVESHEDGLIKG